MNHSVFLQLQGELWRRSAIIAFVQQSNSETDNVMAGTMTETDNLSYGLKWNIVPFRLMLSGRYETVDNSGDGVDNNEDRLETMLRYVVDGTYTLSLGWDTVSYSDAVSPAYDYDQNIVRTGVEWIF